MIKILLLNLPSVIPLYRVLHRAKIGDPSAIWPSVDFIYISGYLAQSGFELEYKDFQYGEKKSMWAFLNSNKYDVIITTYSPFCESDDLSKLQRIKSEHPGTRIILLANHKDRLDKNHTETILRDNPFIEAIVYDFAYNNVSLFIDNIKLNELYNVFYLKDGKLAGSIKVMPDVLTIPVPRHELFVSDSYFHYDSAGGRLTNAMASFGCKKGCQFCWSNKLYPAVVTRGPQNLADEMEYIVKCGIDEVYFHDYTFGYHPDKMLQFCKLIIEKKIKLRWFCSSRFDVMSEELIRTMAKAGCRCIEFGLESGNYDVRKKYGKNVSDEKVREIINLCKSSKIHTSIFVILGLPEENLQDMKRSVNFVASLKVNYVAFNVLWCEPYTGINESLKKDVTDIPVSQSMKRMNFTHPTVTNKQITMLYYKCFLRFYLSPGFIIHQLVSISSFKRIKNLFYLASKILFKNKPK